MSIEPSQLASRLTEIDGLVGAVAVDLDRGAVLGLADPGALGDLELAALLDGELLRHAHAAAKQIPGGETVRSIVVTIGAHHHAILPSANAAGRFLYLVLERREATFGLLLHRLAELEDGRGAFPPRSAGEASEASGQRPISDAGRRDARVSPASRTSPAAPGSRNS